ncbi:DsbC family protein [Malonomonas rubra]|uniref:DsbC family protein n=1 Tax=Malonomonas rubra TaxID=57040 RepID=UPI0026EDC5A3|nr:DsbC family protein [Malonomonas rubra]
MSRLVFSLLILFLYSPLAACAAPVDTNDQLKSVASALRMTFPNIPLQQVHETPVEGVYEIVTQKNEILYFAPRSGHIFAGELWNSQGKNLTRESQARMMTEKLALLPLDKAIKIGDGPNQVVEVSDPDCPFCRDGSAFFSGREDVTRYIFLYPLERIHPQAEAKARFILSSEDQEGAYEDVFSGAYDKQPLPEFKDNGMLDTHREIARSIGIHSTPQYWINGKYISGTNLEKLEEMLDQGPAEKQ